jgi:hypothetical protein
MSKPHYQNGTFQFTLKVNSTPGSINLDSFLKDPSKLNIFVELDLNPESRIYENDEIIFDAPALKDFFKFMADYVDRLSESESSMMEPKNFDFPKGKLSRITKIVLNKNSPATANISYAASYNGDLKPPR